MADHLLNPLPGRLAQTLCRPHHGDRVHFQGRCTLGLASMVFFDTQTPGVCVQWKAVGSTKPTLTFNLKEVIVHGVKYIYLLIPIPFYATLLLRHTVTVLFCRGIG